MKASSCSLGGAERLMRPMAGARAAGATCTGCLRKAPWHRWASPALRPAAQQTRGPTNIGTQRRFIQPQPRAEVLCSEMEVVDSRAVTAGGQAEGPAATLTELWEGVPARTKLTVGCASAFMLSNMDKVNLTIAILPIAHEFGWSSTVSGLVQSSFFWGFLVAQMPGGSLSSRVGGSRMLPTAVGVWSAATALLPFAATSMPALCMSRVAVGLGEALAPSAIVDMLARTIPAEKRAGAVSTAFSGLHFGSILGLIVTPHVIDMFGWRSVFFLYGALGIGWIVGFNMLLEHIAEREPEVARLLKPGGDAAPNAASASGKAVCSNAGAQAGVPYRAMLRSRPVRALMLTHFAHNWFQYTMLAWLPAYFTDTLQVDLMHAAQTALLPPLAGIVASQLAGRGADFLIGNGMPLPSVRKAAQCIAFLGPAALLSLLTFNDDLSSSAALTIACVTGALGLSSFSLAGLYCTHQDLSPKYASAMLGLTNVSGSVPGIVGVALTGFLLDNTGGSWELALFAPSILCLTAGAVVYTTLGKNDPIDLDAANNHPYAWEGRLSSLHRGWSALSRSAGKLSALARRE